jgi:hypothetical protein
MASKSDDINNNAQAPQSASGDQGSVTQHSIPDQIAADKYAQAQRAAQRGGLAGIRFIKTVMPRNG